MRIKPFEPLAMISSLSIAPSPTWGRGNGPETRPGVEPKRGCNSKPPRTSRNPRPVGWGGGQVIGSKIVVFDENSWEKVAELEI
jgi:hypothetical protein